MSAAANPVEATNPVERAAQTCTAHSRAGKRCARYPVLGGSVCYMHGGGAPQVQAKARLRLLMATDPVAAALIEIAKDKKQPASARVSAANSVLDRAGLKADADLVQARVQAIQATVQASTPDGGSVVSEIRITLVDGAPQPQHVNGKAHTNGHANGA